VGRYHPAVERGRITYIALPSPRRDELCSALVERGFQVSAFGTGGEALDALPEVDPEVVVTELLLPDMDGLEVCRSLPERRPGVPVVVVTSSGLDRVVEALRVGALDFLEKPLRPDVLALTLDRAVAHHRIRSEIRLLRRRVRDTQVSALLGESAPMRRLAGLIERVADTSASVLIVGESGTGKELVARQLHQRSRRAPSPFVAINCAAVPEALLESELFGHARGAFTDAKSARRGLFGKADGGTLLLDEIGDMPLGLQPKLLRVIQERTVRPVGSDEEVPIDVRVIAATHRSLDEMVEQERFRGDLLYRLDVIRLEVPPLRDRGADVLVLAQSFLEACNARFGRHVTGFDPSAARRLMEYSWPGNVRELQNCVERAVVLAEHDLVVAEDLQLRGLSAPPRVEPARSLGLSLAQVELAHIRAVLASVDGNKALAARILDIDRKTLRRKLEEGGEA
jgi:two-component system response regulator AtoC